VLFADIASVPADFVKYFVMMCLALGGMWLAHRRGSQASGSKAEPINIAQPLSVDASVSHAPVYAHKQDIDAIKADIERRTRENLRQHEESSKQLAAVIEAGNTRLQSMLTALHDMETRMTKATLGEIRTLHERLNPVAEKVTAHEASIKSHDTRLAELWQWICKIWEHIPKAKKA
jgi:hypothetical protein